MTRTPESMQKRSPASRPHPTDLRHPAADVFFEVFRIARMHGELQGEQAIERGQALQFAEGIPRFHIVQGGPCVLRFTGKREAVCLAAGDIVLVPHGQSHRIEAQALPSRSVKSSSDQPPVRVVSGLFRLEGAAGKALMRGLPGLLHVATNPSDSAEAVGSRQWVSQTIAAMQEEVSNPSIGSRIMVSRIIDLMFIWTVRHWLATAREAETGWIVALRDPLIGHALALLHAQPGAAWTVDKLASAVGQSRSTLSGRFGRLVGQSPMRYLTQWRMQLAGELMSTTSQRVSRIAQELGYESEAAFSRSFRREFGLAPTDYRARQQGQGGVEQLA